MTTPRSDRTKVYLAGPISKGDLRHNLNQAREAARRLMAEGYAPWVPQLTCYMSGDTPTIDGGGTDAATNSGFNHTTWLEVDLPWVMAADAVLRLPGESRGADLEVALARELGIPVYESVDEMLANPPARGDPRFEASLRELLALHRKKATDYGTQGDVFGNVRASQEWGIPSWLGALVRLNDKVVRLKTFARSGKLANEGAADSMIDIAAYALIALILFREGGQAG